MRLHRVLMIASVSLLATGSLPASADSTSSTQPASPQATSDHSGDRCLHEAPATYPSFSDRSLTRLFRSLATARDRDAQTHILTEIRRIGAAAADPTERAIAGQLGGHEAYRLGAFDLAETFFRDLATNVATPSDIRIDALRMSGQILLYVRADPAGGLERYEAMIDAVRRAAAPEHFAAGALAEGYEKSAVALSMLGRYREAAAARSQVYERFAAQRTTDEIAGLLIASAGDLERAGNLRQARDLYQRVLDFFPNYGAADGTSVAIQLSLVRVSAPLVGPARTISSLADVWHNPRNAGFEQTVTAGLGLAKALNDSGRTVEAEQTLLDVLVRITDMMPVDPTQPGPTESLIAMHKTCILNLALAAEERNDAASARSFYELFVNYYPNDVMAAHCWERSLPRPDGR